MYELHNNYTGVYIVGLQRTNIMIDGQLWVDAQELGKKDERSGSWIVNRALREYLAKKSPKKKEVAVIDESDVVLRLPLKSGSHPVTGNDVIKYVAAYSKIDIAQELKSMHSWLESNPAKRKTKTGIGRFINSWLSRANEKGGSGVYQGEY